MEARLEETRGGPPWNLLGNGPTQTCILDYHRRHIMRGHVSVTQATHTVQFW